MCQCDTHIWLKPVFITFTIYSFKTLKNILEVKLKTRGVGVLKTKGLELLWVLHCSERTISVYWFSLHFLQFHELLFVFIYQAPLKDRVTLQVQNDYSLPLKYSSVSFSCFFYYYWNVCVKLNTLHVYNSSTRVSMLLVGKLHRYYPFPCLYLNSVFPQHTILRNWPCIHVKWDTWGSFTFSASVSVLLKAHLENFGFKVALFSSEPFQWHGIVLTQGEKMSS